MARAKGAKIMNFYKEHTFIFSNEDSAVSIVVGDGVCEILATDKKTGKKISTEVTMTEIKAMCEEIQEEY